MTLPPTFGSFGIEVGLSWLGSGSAVPACARWSPRRELCVSSDFCETRCRRPSGCNGSRLEIAGKLGVRRVPDVRYVECIEVPLLWCAGRRPTIVLPMRLCSASSMTTVRP